MEVGKGDIGNRYFVNFFYFYTKFVHMIISYNS